MRFISISTYSPTSRLPTEAEMASMHKFIVEGNVYLQDQLDPMEATSGGDA
jgi:hypothetical protein